MVKINFFPEKWKVIPDFPDYAVSTQGRVMRVIPSKSKFAHTYPGKLLKPVEDYNGYLCIGLFKNGSRKGHSIARLVALCFLGPCPNGKEINHKNAIKTDNTLDNLEYITHAQNMQHAFALGLLRSKGESNPAAKLQNKDVLAIIKLRKLGWTHQNIANQFPVHRVTICDILSGKTWNSVTGIK